MNKHTRTMELLIKCPNCYNNSEPYEISEIEIGKYKYSSMTCPCCGKSYIADEVIQALKDSIEENNTLRERIEELEDKISRMRSSQSMTDEEAERYVAEQISRATNCDE